MIWTKPLTWFLMGSSGLPLAAPVTSECVPYRDVCYTQFPNAGMDIMSRRKREYRYHLEALPPNNETDDRYMHYLLEEIDFGHQRRLQYPDSIVFNKQLYTWPWKTIPPPTIRKATLTPRMPDENGNTTSISENSKSTSAWTTKTRIPENGNTTSISENSNSTSARTTKTRIPPLNFMLTLMDEAETMKPENKVKHYNRRWGEYISLMESELQSMANKIRSQENKIRSQENKIRSRENKIRSRENKITSQEKKIRSMHLKLLKQSLPVQLTNEFDRFVDLYQFKITFTTEEDKRMNKINNKNQKARERLLTICKRAITDLHEEEPLLKQLYTEINNIEEYQNLKSLSETKRIETVCEALVALKYDRNAKIHEIFMKGPKIDKIKLFPQDSWNEAIAAFLNGHKTGVEFQTVVYKTTGAEHSESSEFELET